VVLHDGFGLLTAFNVRQPCRVLLRLPHKLGGVGNSGKGVGASNCAVNLCNSFVVPVMSNQNNLISGEH
jgi:hypothetical protein